LLVFYTVLQLGNNQQLTINNSTSNKHLKHLIHTLNKAFDHRVRLGVMAVLMANDGVSFTDLKEALDLTDGNLASHVAALEKAGYVEVSKQFVGKKPNTTYTASKDGKQAFQDHLAALEKLLRG
jgi:DNA-binding MarR family transcriptional regulator